MHSFHRNWWIFLLNGILAILFGLLAIAAPRAIIIRITKYFGILIALAGLVFLIAGIIRATRDKNFWHYIFKGLSGMIPGLLIVLYPKITLTLMLVFIGVWIALLGIFQIWILINARKFLSQKNLILIIGLLTIALGLFLIFNPFEATMLLTVFMGIMSVIIGAFLIYISFIIKKSKSSIIWEEKE
jgi:uncharacterized membrane protein HdeD (DUF308 family)